MAVIQGSAAIAGGAVVGAAAAMLVDVRAALIGGSALAAAVNRAAAGRAAIQGAAQTAAHYQTIWTGSAAIQGSGHVAPQLPIQASAAIVGSASVRVGTNTIPAIRSLRQLNTAGDTAPYLDLITAEHNTKPNFMATVAKSIQPIVDAAAAMAQTPAFYDLDAAIGAQLDTVGQWVGTDRNLAEPITNVYFTWDSDSLGWDTGFWQGPFDPDNGIIALPDESFRTLIRAKIAANNWDGTIPGAYDAWDSLFGGALQLLIQDFQNMTMAMGILSNSGVVDPIVLALLTSGKLDIRPGGVSITDYFTGSIPGQAVFSWDVDPPTQSEAGWDIGNWSIQLK